MLIGVINYIKTPQQYETFASFQRIANRELPASKQEILEPVKPVITRWNSFCSAFERAVRLQPAFNSYTNYHVEQQRGLDSHARGRGNKTPDAPAWMRSGGLNAADWAVITEYIAVLQPLKFATKRLEGRGKGGRFGAIYEIIPVFKYLLARFEELVLPFEDVDYEQLDAPEDHLAINVQIAWAKLRDYDEKLDESPVYYAATCLHPAYKLYCDRAWRDKGSPRGSWLATAAVGFRTLYGAYITPRNTETRPRERVQGAIDEAIAAVMGGDSDNDDEFSDEYERWRRLEPQWTNAQLKTDCPIKYWVALRHKYPMLSRFAIDILSIPAASSECERMFSKVGDLLAP
jgi:hypothetical protein